MSVSCALLHADPDHSAAPFAQFGPATLKAPATTSSPLEPPAAEVPSPFNPASTKPSSQPQPMSPASAAAPPQSVEPAAMQDNSVKTRLIMGGLPRIGDRSLAHPERSSST